MKLGLLAVGMLLLLPRSVPAQQWDSDPVVDRMKRAEAALVDYENMLAYCQKHPQETECDGFRENPPSTFVPYDQALKAGEQRSDNQKPVSLGEAARQARIEKLEKQLEPAIRDVCEKNPSLRGCKEGTPSEIAHRLAVQEVLRPNSETSDQKQTASDSKSKDQP
jgi:hypothetical protein